MSPSSTIAAAPRRHRSAELRTDSTASTAPLYRPAHVSASSCAACWLCLTVPALGRQRSEDPAPRSPRAAAAPRQWPPSPGARSTRPPSSARMPVLGPRAPGFRRPRLHMLSGAPFERSFQRGSSSTQAGVARAHAGSCPGETRAAAPANARLAGKSSSRTPIQRLLAHR
jgi:hypothetical protein